MPSGCLCLHLESSHSHLKKPRHWGKATGQGRMHSEEEFIRGHSQPRLESTHILISTDSRGVGPEKSERITRPAVIWRTKANVCFLSHGVLRWLLFSVLFGPVFLR